MKKIIRIVAALLCLLLLAGCGGQKENTDPAVPTGPDYLYFTQEQGRPYAQPVDGGEAVRLLDTVTASMKTALWLLPPWAPAPASFCPWRTACWCGPSP